MVEVKEMNDLIRRNYEFECRAEKNESNASVLVGRPIVYVFV